MRIGRFIEVLEIVPDETPGLNPDRVAQPEYQDGYAPVAGPLVDCVDQAQGRSAAFAS